MGTVVLNGYRYAEEIVEMMRMAYLYSNVYTQQFEKFYGNPNVAGCYTDFERLIKEWEDMQAAMELLLERWGREYHTNMNDYVLEMRYKGVDKRTNDVWWSTER